MKTDWCNKAVAMPWKGNEHFTELLVWLSNNVDERDWDWDIARDSGQHHRIYYFARREDAIMFTMRWV